MSIKTIASNQYPETSNYRTFVNDSTGQNSTQDGQSGPNWTANLSEIHIQTYHCVW